jgi:hypothetical protein
MSSLYVDSIYDSAGSRVLLNSSSNTFVQLQTYNYADTWSAAPGASNWAVTPMSVFITPQSTSNKIIVWLSVHFGYQAYNAQVRLRRSDGIILNAGTADLSNRQSASFVTNQHAGSNNQYHLHCLSGHYVDDFNKPSGGFSYTLEAKCYGTNSVYINRAHNYRDTTDYEYKWQL